MSETNTPAPRSRRAFLRACAVGAVGVGFATAARADAAKATVKIDNFTFSPTPLTVAPGTTVVWVNQDDIPHSIFCEQLKLHSHPLDTNDSFSHKFDQVGSFDYICAIHPHMRGRIVVQG